jgi:hypothetical protein
MLTMRTKRYLGSQLSAMQSPNVWVSLVERQAHSIGLSTGWERIDASDEQISLSIHISPSRRLMHLLIRMILWNELCL